MSLQATLKGSPFENQIAGIQKAFFKKNITPKDYGNLVSIFGMHVGGVNSGKLQSFLIAFSDKKEEDKPIDQKTKLVAKEAD